MKTPVPAHHINKGRIFETYEKFFRQLWLENPQEVVLSQEDFHELAGNAFGAWNPCGEREGIELAFDHGPVVFRRGDW